MNLSSIMQVQDAAVRKLLFEDWKQDQVWKNEMEHRVRELEELKRPQKGSDLLKRLEYKSNVKKISYQSDNSA